MEKLRNLMETAVGERWHERTSPLESGSRPQTMPKKAPQHDTAIARDAAKNQDAAKHANRIRRESIGPETLTRNRLVAALPQNLDRQSYCLLQAEVMQYLSSKQARSIGVTSPSDGSGKTLTTVNLAISIAVETHRPVMIIDLDFRRPAVHRLFNVKPKLGIEDCLFNGAKTTAALFSPAIDNLTVLPARGTCQAIAQVLRSVHLKTLLAEIKRTFAEEILVIDLPSITSADDGECYQALVDGLLLVVANAVTETEAYCLALDSIDERKLIGTVLNRVPA